MAFLLDTHTFYWVIRDSVELSSHHRRLLIETDQPVFVSSVTGWEIATKVRIGKWPEAASLVPGLKNVLERAGFEHLPLSIGQAEQAGSFQVGHKDPFDRLLASQALDLELTILSVDPAMSLFGCKVI
jgi:PIN domain nuclease of toxin-antitoxin system